MRETRNQKAETRRIETRKQKSETRSENRSRITVLVSGFWFLISPFLVSGFWFLVFACARPIPTAAPLPPPPAPVPVPVAVVEPVKLPTLDEVRSLRTNNQLDLYEAGLKTMIG